MVELNLNKETLEWLDLLMESHHLKTREEAIYKMIEIHKAWNAKL